MRKVRIARNRVNFRQSLFRALNVLNVCLGIYQRHTRAASHDYITELRAEKIRMEMQVAEMRRQKLANDLVLQDQKIEENNRRMGYRPGEHDPFQ